MLRALLTFCAVVALAGPAAATTSFTALARDPWNDTGVDVRAGETLAVNVSGEWRDFLIPATADGYASPWHMKPFERFRRLPKARWFALVGCVGDTLAHCQVMSAGQQTLVMPATGRLFLFANDAPGFYWNNSGALQVEIGHKAPPR